MSDDDPRLLGHKFEPREMRLLRKLNCFPNGLCKARPSVRMAQDLWEEFVSRLYARLDGNRDLGEDDWHEALDMANWLNQSLCRPGKVA